MAELTINTDDITAALRKNLEGFTPDMEAAQVGRVIEVGDGIARVSGPARLRGQRDARVRGRHDRPGPQPRRGVDRRRGPRRRRRHRGGPAGAGHRRHPLGAGRRRPARSRRQRPRRARSTARAPLTNVTTRRMEVQAPGIIGRKPVHEPLQTGIKAIDSMTPIGRGQRELIIGDRKTGKTTGGDRHDHQPEGPGREVHLRRHRAEGVDGRPDGEHPRAATAPWTTRSSSSPPASDPAPFKYLAPYAGCAMGQHWMENGEHALGGLRRPVEAGRGLPPGVAAAAPAAGPRGLPGRRLLPAQPSARAGGQAVRRRTAPVRSPPCR